ncbi:MAG: hypothetical protein AB8U93_02840, partial [Francisella endosymbiont of Hyalomma scupense]
LFQIHGRIRPPNKIESEFVEVKVLAGISIHYKYVSTFLCTKISTNVYNCSSNTQKTIPKI